MQIRPAQINELTIIEQLARQIWPSTYAQIISEAQITYMLDKMYSFGALQTQFNAGHEFYILNSNGRDIGFIALEWLILNHNTQIKINKLYVLAALQGKGSGRLLLQKAIERATETNATALFLQVNKANTAKNFYLKLGFHIQEETVFDIGQGFVMDDYIMTLPL